MWTTFSFAYNYINNKDKGFIFVIPADEYNAAMTIYFLEKKEVYN